MASNRVVAFLDLLGFRDHMVKDKSGAVMLLDNYQEIIVSKLNDQAFSPVLEYPSEKLQKLAKSSFVDSFEYFIPFSDSIFIVSDDPNIFTEQVSKFLLDSFFYTANVYITTKSKDEPEKVTVNSIEVCNSGKITTRKRHENWYPTLFRGGISYGTVYPKELIFIKKGQIGRTSSMFGPAVVEAVKLESTDRGPRLFCDLPFFNSLSNDLKHFVVRTNTENIYEILWTRFHYIEPDTNRIEIHQFLEIFTPAVRLWEAYKGEDFAEHYFNFLKLIIQGSLKFFEVYGDYEISKKYIISKVRESIPLGSFSDLLGQFNS